MLLAAVVMAIAAGVWAWKRFRSCPHGNPWCTERRMCQTCFQSRLAKVMNAGE